MPRREVPALQDSLAALAVDAARSQRLLDERFEQVADRWRRRVARETDSLAREIAMRLVPDRHLFERHEIELAMMLETRRSRGFGVAAELHGKPIHQFHHARFSVSEAETQKVMITIEAAPRPPRS